MSTPRVRLLVGLVLLALVLAGIQWMVGWSQLLAPWRAIGADATERLHGLLRPLAKAVAESGVLPAVNPIGIRW